METIPDPDSQSQPTPEQELNLRYWTVLDPVDQPLCVVVPGGDMGVKVDVEVRKSRWRRIKRFLGRFLINEVLGRSLDYILGMFQRVSARLEKSVSSHPAGRI